MQMHSRLKSKWWLGVDERQKKGVEERKRERGGEGEKISPSDKVSTGSTRSITLAHMTETLASPLHIAHNYDIISQLTTCHKVITEMPITYLYTIPF